MLLVDLQLKDEERCCRKQEQNDMGDSLEGEYHVHNIAHELLHNAPRALRYGIQIIEYAELEEYEELNDKEDHRKEDQDCLHDHIYSPVLGNGRQHGTDHAICYGEQQDIDRMPAEEFLLGSQTEYQLIIEDRERDHGS